MMTRPKGIDWDAVFCERANARRVDIARECGVSPQAVSAAFAARLRPCSDGCLGGFWCAKNWLRCIPAEVTSAPGTWVSQARCGGALMRVEVANGTASFALEMWAGDNGEPVCVESEERWGKRELSRKHDENPAVAMRALRAKTWSQRWQR